MNHAGLWTSLRKIAAVLVAVTVFCVVINVHPSSAVLDSVDHVHVSDSGDGMPGASHAVHKATGSHGLHEEHSHPVEPAVPGEDGTALTFDRTAWKWQDDPCRCSGPSALERPPRVLAAL